MHMEKIPLLKRKNKAEWAREGVSTPRPEILARKIAALEEGGVEKLHVVADFDRTLTSGASAHKEMVTNASMGILLTERFMAKDFIDNLMALFKKYYPAETDPTLPVEQKAALMEEWFKQAFDLVTSSGMSREKIRDMALSDMVTPRNNVEGFLGTTRRFGIPTLIFSAGFGDFIIEYLKHHKLYSPFIHVISNFARYNTEGKIVGWNENIIHPFNKNESHSEFPALASVVKNRPNVLLVGDSASDIHMADGARHATVLSIGFLNGKESLRQSFEAEYDIVVGKDAAFRVPNTILNKVARTTS